MAQNGFASVIAGRIKMTVQSCFGFVFQAPVEFGHAKGDKIVSGRKTQ
jgi:hypothetical protein